MKHLLRSFSAPVASLLIAVLLIPPAAWARSKPLDAATVHARIVKRGLDNWVGVEQANGVALFGRIIAINPDTFTLQLPNDPEPVTVAYANVIDLRTGFTRGQKIFGICAIAGTAAFAIWGFVHVHDLQQQKLPEPTAPAFP